MPKNRSGRLVFALFVLVLAWVIGRNVHRHYQENALENAVRSRDDGKATVLLKQGVFANQPQKLVWLLDMAVMNNEPNAVRTLLQQGVNPNSASNWSDPPLVIAASNCPSVVGLLLDKGAKVNARSDTDASLRRTALSAAIDSRHLATMRLLLDQGANVNLNSRYGRSPLVLATKWGDKEAVKMLLERGANVNDNLPGQTALELAVELRRSALVPLLSSQANQTTKSKALGVAVTTGSVAMVRVLLAVGARPAPQSNAWRAALYTARRQSETGKPGYTNTLTLLRPFGVTTTQTKTEIEARNPDGQTALMAALSQGNTAEAQHLLAQGANVNAVDKKGRTPLLEAVEHGSSLVSALLDKGANPNILTTLGNTPLHQAIQGNNVAVVRLLLAHGANPNLHSPHMSSSLVRARRHNQAAIVTLLQQAGTKE